MCVRMHVAVVRVRKRGGWQSVGRGHGRRDDASRLGGGASQCGSTNAPLGDYVDIIERPRSRSGVGAKRLSLGNVGVTFGEIKMANGTEER